MVTRGDLTEYRCVVLLRVKKQKALGYQLAKGFFKMAERTGLEPAPPVQHGRSYAPVGKTPVQALPAKRVSLNMVSAIINQGMVRFMLYEYTITTEALIKFMRADCLHPG